MSAKYVTFIRALDNYLCSLEMSLECADQPVVFRRRRRRVFKGDNADATSQQSGKGDEGEILVHFFSHAMICALYLRRANSPHGDTLPYLRISQILPLTWKYREIALRRLNCLEMEKEIL